MERVAAFTDTYLPTVNGVTYTVTTWRDRWHDRGGRMSVVYPSAADYDPAPGEFAVRSLPFPFYDGYRLGLPTIPRSLRHDAVDLVHVHTPFSVGAAGIRLARRRGLPIVGSYHTPTGEYTNYIVPHPRLAGPLGRVSRRWERFFLDRTDVVVVPSEPTADHLRRLGVRSRLEVIPNGVDTERFRPVPTDGFLAEHDIETGRPLVGYTGRHGHEKRLDELLAAAERLDVTLVLGGDGPAREHLEREAAASDLDVRFLGFLDRSDLAAFYAALDVFAFPSPVETQGIVALEAMACGTPVVGAASAALAETIEDGVTGYHYQSGDVSDFARSIERALENRETLGASCLDRREAMSVERTIDRLEALYGSVA